MREIREIREMKKIHNSKLFTPNSARAKCPATANSTPNAPYPMTNDK
jgi:hypothetical protein